MVSALVCFSETWLLEREGDNARQMLGEQLPPREESHPRGHLIRLQLNMSQARALYFSIRLRYDPRTIS